MPAPLHVFSLGPIPVGTTSTTLYMGWQDGRVLSSRHHTPDEALHELRAMAPLGVPLICSPELAVPGARHGFRNLPLPDEVRRARAHLAFSLAHVDLAPPPAAPADALLAAAAAFWAARPWTRLPADTPLPVTVSGEVTATYEGAILGEAGEEFGIALYPKAGSLAKLIRAIDQGRPDRHDAIDVVSLTFDTEPIFALDAITSAYGCPRVPLALSVKKGKPRPASVSEVLTLAAVLMAFTTMEGTPGEEGTATLSGGDRGVTARARVPEPSAPR